MTESEVANSKKGQSLGFFTFAILLLIDVLFSRLKGIDTFSSLTILLSGFVVSLSYETILNLKDKSRKKTGVTSMDVRSIPFLEE